MNITIVAIKILKSISIYKIFFLSRKGRFFVSNLDSRLKDSKPVQKQQQKSFLKFICGVFLLLSISPAWAFNAAEETKLLAAADGASSDYFGSSLAVDGQTALVGAYSHDESGLIDSGAAYIFTRDGAGNWNEQAKLTASDGEADDWFGYAVALSGDTAVVGVHRDDSSTGSVYVFTRDISGAWSQQAKLLAADGAGYDLFGRSVAISGDTIVVGANRESVDAGAAYVFTRDSVGSWTQVAKLQASDWAYGDEFGYAVAIDNGTMLVSARLDDDNGNHAGSAYIFTRDTSGVWTEQTKLLVSDGEAGDQFGFKASLSGQTALISSFGDDSNLGAAYAFTTDINGAWTQQVKLLSSPRVMQVGISVSISGDTALMGSSANAAYVFTRDSTGIWTQSLKIIDSDDPTPGFGSQAAISGDTVLIGAQLDDDIGQDAGAVHTFLLSANSPPIANAGPDQTAYIGTLTSLDGSGSTDPDGDYPLSYAWSLVVAPLGSTATLTDANTVQASFTPDVWGDYFVELIVTDSKGNASSKDIVKISTVNTPPVADPGDSKVAMILGDGITLDGSASYDPDGDTLVSYRWSVGPEVILCDINRDPTCPPAPYELLDADQAIATFVPYVEGSWNICLVVMDEFSAFSSNRDNCITVSFTNLAPTAEAGGNQSVVVGTQVFLDGSASSDPNNDPLTYSWRPVSQPGLEMILLTSTSMGAASFVPEIAGTYVISLVVNDGKLNSEADTVTVQAVSADSAATAELITTTETINTIDPINLMNANLAGALTNKINSVLALIEAGDYVTALNKLEKDILPKTNGCAEGGAPDKNDWIKSCVEQESVYNSIVDTINYLKTLI